MTQAVFRFAPSPNGSLHLGHAYSALLNQLLAKKVGGKLLLRIENTDEVRCTPVLEQRMLEDLLWLGIEFDEEPRRQSEYKDEYLSALELLDEKGLVYRGYLSRMQARRQVEEATGKGQSWPCDPDGVPHYPTLERNLPQAYHRQMVEENQPYTMRLNMDKAIKCLDQLKRGPLVFQEEGAGPTGQEGIVEAAPGQWGDFMIFGRDGSAAYHLACVVDDAIQGITHVVRGRDLFYSTCVHRMLQELLDLPQPVYIHHDLILDDNGMKLSKSRGDTSLAQLRSRGASPDDIARMVGL